MFILPRPLLLLLLACSVALRADDSLAQVQRARTMLGGETWSQVIRVENQSRAHRYPRIVHALVFEFADLLWFYTPSEGTQSFSLHRGQLEREKADFAPLLLDIDPGFRRWSVLPAAKPARANGPTGPIPNACFIESIATLRDLLARGVPVREPRLLSYYLATASGLAGHTVLAYDVPDAVEVFDPGRPDERRVFGPSLRSDALVLARALEGADVVKARYIPIPLAGTRIIASASGERAPSGPSIQTKRS